MHRVVVVRHAKADPKQHTVHPDHERPLTDRGRQDARLAGRWLAGPGPVVDRALVSTSVRTRQTWEAIAAELPDPPPAAFEEGLYHTDPDTILARLRRLPKGTATVALVGHNPGLLDLVLDLAGSATGDLRTRLEESGLRTAGIVVLSLPGPWADLAHGTAHLDTAWSPRA
jgi:phosphohistidine phosphatase